jgi:hypothetical protein
MDIHLVSYLVVLVAGAALTVTIGTILRHSGQAMLEETHPDQRAQGLTRLVTVGFHLVAFGVLALISTVDIPVAGVVQAVVTKLGMVLLILGAAYALTLMVLGRIQNARRAVELDQAYSATLRARP